MNKNIKIAIIGSRGYPYVYSGYETLVKELSERLVKNGYKVRVYCHSSLFKIKPKYVNGIQLVYTPSIETKILSQFINSFFSTLHFCFSSYDTCIYVNSANGPFGILTSIFSKKTCINVDGLEWLRPKWKGIGSKYYKFSSFLSTIFFDKIITDSYEMKKIYLKKYKKKSNVIAYGSTMIKNPNSDLLNELNIKTNEYYLVVGRLIPDNNSLLIINGFKKSNTKKKLVIVGDVPYSDSYEKKVKSFSSDEIIFTGYIICQKKLSTLYKNCFGYIHGHEFGGTNPTMINALDFNCSVLALNTPFNKEMLNKKNVVFYEKDINSVKNSITNFENNIGNLKKSNINYELPKKYCWEYITEKYISLIEKI